MFWGLLCFERFRRTLVGLKQSVAPSPDGEIVFQTNPCGVEARSCTSLRSCTRTFQTNPCGVEAHIPLSEPYVVIGFQTNPCGVEATECLDEGPNFVRFRRTLVGLKPFLLVGVILWILVSDEPLWG